MVRVTLAARLARDRACQGWISLEARAQTVSNLIYFWRALERFDRVDSFPHGTKKDVKDADCYKRLIKGRSH
jgi:hypothetical protein